MRHVRCTLEPDMVEDEQPRFHLADLRDITGSEFSDVRRSIRSRLRDQGVLFSADYHALRFHTLALFDFDTAPAYDDYQALDEQSLHVLTLVGAYRDGQNLENVERTLVREVLGFRTTPGGERDRQRPALARAQDLLGAVLATGAQALPDHARGPEPDRDRDHELDRLEPVPDPDDRLGGRAPRGRRACRRRCRSRRRPAPRHARAACAGPRRPRSAARHRRPRS